MYTTIRRYNNNNYYYNYHNLLSIIKSIIRKQSSLLLSSKIVTTTKILQKPQRPGTIYNITMVVTGTNRSSSSSGTDTINNNHHNHPPKSTTSSKPTTNSTATTDTTSSCFPKIFTRKRSHNNSTTTTTDDDNINDTAINNNNNNTSCDTATNIVSRTKPIAFPAGTQPQHQEVEEDQPPPMKKKFFSIFSKKIPKNPSIRNYTTSTTTTDGVTTSSTSSNSNSRRRRRPQIYCDLDGVLVDFQYGIEQLQNLYNQSKNPNKPIKFNLWKSISKTKHFYRTLPWTKDGKVLWYTIQHLQPYILTGIPHGNTSIYALDKYHWCQRELQYISKPTLPQLTSSNDSCNDTTESIVPITTTTIQQDDTKNNNHHQTTNTMNNNNTINTIHDTSLEVQNIQNNQIQWIWKNMAGPKQSHQRINISIPDPANRLVLSSEVVNVVAESVQSPSPSIDTVTNQKKCNDTTTESKTTMTDNSSSTTTRNNHATNIQNNNNNNTTPSQQPIVITCWSKNKHYECHHIGDVLIDDRPDHYNLKLNWESKGGIFIHHTSSYNTIQQLIQYNIIHPNTSLLQLQLQEENNKSK